MDNIDDCETCWICLEGADGPDCRSGQQHANRLIRPCRCPRVVHSVCLAKWQLSQTGKSEEKFCRFCQERLPDWQANLALPGMAAVEPVMSVHFNGQTHMVKVKPGEEGRQAFIADVRRLLRLRDNQEFSITFECKVPGHGMFLDLKGLSSYDAAVFCAAMTAVERQLLAAQKTAARTPLIHHQHRHRHPHRHLSSDITTTATAPNQSSSSSSSSSAVPPIGRRRSSPDGASTSSDASTPATPPSAAARTPGLSSSGRVTGALGRLTSARRAASAYGGGPRNTAAAAASDASSDLGPAPASPSLLSATDSASGSSLGEVPAPLSRSLGASAGERRASLTGGESAAGRFLPPLPHSPTSRPSASAPTSPSASSASQIGMTPRLAAGDTGSATGNNPASTTAPGGGSGVAHSSGARSTRLVAGPGGSRLEARSHGACEVEPTPPGPAEGAGARAAAGSHAASGAASGTGTFGRRKSLRQVWHGLPLVGGSHHHHHHHHPTPGAAEALTTSAAPMEGVMSGSERRGSPWLSRLLMCGGFGANTTP